MRMYEMPLNQQPSDTKEMNCTSTNQKGQNFRVRGNFHVVVEVIICTNLEIILIDANKIISSRINEIFFRDVIDPIFNVMM